MGKKCRVINQLRDQTLQVDIRDAKGNLSTVSIVPRGRIELSVGSTVDSRYLSLNGNNIRVVMPDDTSALDAPTTGGNE